MFSTVVCCASYFVPSNNTSNFLSIMSGVCCQVRAGPSPLLGMPSRIMRLFLCLSLITTYPSRPGGKSYHFRDLEGNY